MKTTRHVGIAACCLLILLVLPGVLAGVLAGQAPGEQGEAARRFVQGFYDWYLQKALKNPNTPGTELVLKQKRANFAAPLAETLEKDLTAAAKSPDEVVGLDFDPFLNSQDPCARYEVGTVRTEEGRYLAPVYAICAGKRARKPDVVAKIAATNGRWEFVNFLYPNFPKQSSDADLISVLKKLAKERGEHSK